jgi:hypothetical protein
MREYLPGWNALEGEIERERRIRDLMDPPAMRALRDSLDERERILRSLAGPLIEIESLQTAIDRIKGLEQIVSPALTAADEVTRSLRTLGESAASWAATAMASTRIHDSWRVTLAGLTGPEEAFDTRFAVADQLHLMLSLASIAESKFIDSAHGGFGSLLGVTETTAETIELSVARLGTELSGLLNAYEHDPELIVRYPPLVSQSPALEMLRAGLLTSAISNSTEQISVAEEEKAGDVRSALDHRLSDLNPAFLVPLQGARRALSSDNPDRIRQGLVSLRELGTQVLHLLAPTNAVLAWSSNPADIHNGRPTRRARIRYVVRRVDIGSFEGFMSADVDSVRAMLDVLQRATHEVPCSITPEQADLLLVRFEGWLDFVLEIHAMA